jgi:1-acyl-sn-glycerol-3-phosphate acyltransferase
VADAAPAEIDFRRLTLTQRVAQRAISGFFRMMLRTLYGLRTLDLPRLEGAYIVAPNHASFMDPMILQVAMDRQVTFIMDAARFYQPGLTWLYRLWGAIPLPEGGSATGAIKLALAAVERGEIVGIFPEGRISRDGKLQEGQAGVALLLQKSGVPVVPAAILGAYEILPRHATFPRPGRLLVAFGRPIEPQAAGAKKDGARALKDRVMKDIAELQAANVRLR